MPRAPRKRIDNELALVKNALEALLSGREGALDSRGWRAAIEAVYALCSVPPSHFRRLLLQTSVILRRHLNSVRRDILNSNTAAASGHATAVKDHATVVSGNATAASGHATATPNDIAATLSRVGANLKLNLPPIFSDTQPRADCEAPKALLQRYATAWKTFLKTIEKIEPMYMHFNRQLQTSRKAEELNKASKCTCEEHRIYTACSVTYSYLPKELKELALQKWLERVMVPAGKALRGAVTRALRSECEGRPFISQAVLKTVIDSFHEVREFDTKNKGALHQEWVVQPYLAAARVQHAERARALLAEGDLSHYMRHVLAVNVHELVTLLAYFGQLICREVQINFQEAAVVPHVRRLHAAAAGIVSAAAARPSPTALHDLHHLFLLLRVVDALPPLLDAARLHVLTEGRAMLARPKQFSEIHDHFVNTIMSHRQKYCLLFAEVFEGDKLLCLNVVDKAFRVLVNDDIRDAAADSRGGGGGGGTTWRAAELLARYCDALLRRRGEDFRQIKLSAASLIFMYLNEKDAFQDTHQKMLAKRLLNHSSPLKLEEMFITGLRHAGTEFNGKLRVMCKDFAASFALNEKFREWIEEKREPLLWGGDEDCREHSVQVLQGWAWPIANVPAPWVAPAPLERYTRQFEAFHRERHPRRRLAWLHELCTGELTLRYAARPYRLTATGAQCGLLLAFQERDRWGADELRQRLRLPRPDWAKQLQPLLKLRLLLAAGDVLDGDARGGVSETPCATLTLNLDFSHERLEIKITCSKVPAKQPAPSPEAQAPAPSRRDLRCKAYTQALLMRIMKKHKVLHHDELLKETEAQSNGWFSPAPELVKTYIDELVFKEYLEPVPGHSDTYKYLP